MKWSYTKEKSVCLSSIRSNHAFQYGKFIFEPEIDRWVGFNISLLKKLKNLGYLGKLNKVLYKELNDDEISQENYALMYHYRGDMFNDHLTIKNNLSSPIKRIVDRIVDRKSYQSDQYNCFTNKDFNMIKDNLQNNLTYCSVMKKKNKQFTKSYFDLYMKSQSYSSEEYYLRKVLPLRKFTPSFFEAIANIDSVCNHALFKVKIERLYVMNTFWITPRRALGRAYTIAIMNCNFTCLNDTDSDSSEHKYDIQDKIENKIIKLTSLLSTDRQSRDKYKSYHIFNLINNLEKTLSLLNILLD